MNGPRPYWARHAARRDPGDDDTGGEALAIANIMLDGNRQIWEDQVKLADTLETKRRTYWVLLLAATIIAGARFSAGGIPSGETATNVLRSAAVLWMVSAYFLFTERSLFRRFLEWVTREWPVIGAGSRFRWALTRLGIRVGMGARSEDFEAERFHGPYTLRSGRAINSIAMSDIDACEMLEFPEEYAVQDRAEAYLRASRRLFESNDRVRTRIELATFGAMLSIFLAMWLFAFPVTPAAATPDYIEVTPEPLPEIQPNPDRGFPPHNED